MSDQGNDSKSDSTTTRAGKRAPAPGRRAARATTFIVALASAVGFITTYQPPRALARAPFGDHVPLDSNVPRVRLASSAFGRSGALQVRFALPGERVDYPLELRGDTTGLDYVWERLADSMPIHALRPFTGDSLMVPADPGFYQLALVRDGLRRVVNGLTLAVIVPFDAKKGPVLDGYRMGTYPGERSGHADPDRPAGFVRVTADEADLQITRHLRLSDFLTRDGQDTWPRYAAVNPRVLDKLELVVERISHSLGERTPEVEVDVHSAFRTPAWNRRVPRAARDSRHQFGDAVDVAIDANGDGRMDARDARLVAAAVDSVEAEYPDLVGGMGLYTSGRYRHPYVHIDARGTRARWRG
ncbi:MAG TPA: D-Ala-D-Ala carboxypeptidase family metallohydrolase [Gemmatimonadaceae bacterium]|nr:D-Ala-D-Ala carboxypeptidase family metallohydrolase [Gemmatimonadaceae bacterium]